MEAAPNLEGKIPVLLLKTKSTPNDGYGEYFGSLKTADGGASFAPVFIPVLEHRYNEENLRIVRQLLKEGKFGEPKEDDCSAPDVPGTKRYGGMIFTSQRAVEGFTDVVEAARVSHGLTSVLSRAFFYVVGPATFRTLSSIRGLPPSSVHGAHTGNGEALANFIGDHYKTPHLPLLFLVGEQRRDIIPTTLTANGIQVDELVVYETGVMTSFASDFADMLDRITPPADHTSERDKWIVVFSPTGCDTMLQGLELLSPEARKTTYVATIGPTTRDFLIDKFGFKPDVCSATPTPEGLGEGILRFMEGLKRDRDPPQSGRTT